jgi:hypothetical protein
MDLWIWLVVWVVVGAASAMLFGVLAGSRVTPRRNFERVRHGRHE